MTKSSWMQWLMSGNPTNDAYFLDSCVYINYGTTGNLFHDESVDFFSKGCLKHTSTTVLGEIEDFKSFMSRFGRDLNAILAKVTVNRVANNPWIYFQGYNENQQPVIEQFLQEMLGRSPLDISNKYRNFKSIVIDKIDEALSMTEQPIIQQSNDQPFIALIEYINDSGDKQIIADAALWAAQFRFRRFCTADNEHIMKHKTQLELTICKHYKRNCLIFTHLNNA